MAVTHQSGFGGSITWNAGAGPGPLALVSSTTLQKWSIAQETGTVEAYAKGDTWKTKFPTVNRWSADVESLVSDAVTPATEMIVGQTITSAKFIINATDFLTGSGKVVSMTISDPLDGPVVAKLKILGNGVLTPTATV